MKKTRNTIALLGNGFTNWGGGIDFLRFCVNALALVCGKSARLVILLPDPECTAVVTRIRGFLSPYKRMLKSAIAGERPRFQRIRPFSRSQLIDSFKNIDGNVEILFYSPREKLTSVVSRIQADVIIPSSISLGSSFPIPWVGYVYDFQHKYYPDYFSSEEIRDRDALFSTMLSEAPAVIVNAADVKKDIQKFYPKTACQVFDLPFSATPIESWFDPPSENVSMKYNLPEKYFVMCNQFWIHKDHATAFRALAVYIKNTGHKDVHIVCTGKTIDTRHPNYFHRLKQTVDVLGLTDKIHFLGHIPKKDQIDIMCGSIAVLQPTLFEGGPGGGAVYDAVAMGVPAILSDIPVNVEIKGLEGLLFFKVTDVDDMAVKMNLVHNIEYVRPNKKELLSAGRARTMAYGLRLLEAINYVLNVKDKSGRL